jgi:hypothetical protein
LDLAYHGFAAIAAAPGDRYRGTLLRQKQRDGFSYAGGPARNHSDLAPKTHSSF